MIAASWRQRWEHIIPFLALPADLRRAVYTTNSIENLNRQIRKTIKTRGAFPDESAATKLIYLAIIRAEGEWKALQLDRRPQTPQDPLRRPTPRLTMNPVTPASHTEERTVSPRTRPSTDEGRVRAHERHRRGRQAQPRGWNDQRTAAATLRGDRRTRRRALARARIGALRRIRHRLLPQPGRTSPHPDPTTLRWISNVTGDERTSSALTHRRNRHTRQHRPVQHLAHARTSTRRTPTNARPRPPHLRLPPRITTHEVVGDVVVAVADGSSPSRLLHPEGGRRVVPCDGELAGSHSDLVVGCF